MVEEDQNPLSGNSTSVGGLSRSSSSKKLKQKKVPQRGLGVAQLEKIRIEEQQKKDVPNTKTNFSSSSTTLSPTHSSSIPIAPFPNYPHNKQSKSPVPFCPPSPSPSPSSNLTSSNPIFRTGPIPDIENFHLGPVPELNPSNIEGGYDVGWPSLPAHGNVSVSLPMLWHPYEFNHDHKKGENSRLNNHGFSFQPNLSLPYENCPIGLPDVVPRTQQYQQPTTLMNVSSSSSSVLSFPMEPPSSQSFFSSYPPLWPDEEKMMVGTKRPCPFPLDSPPIPTFHGKFAPMATPISRSDDSTTCASGGTTFNFDPAIPIFRDVPTCPSAMPEPSNSKKSSRSENGNPNGEFLTLAPPAIPPFPSSRYKQSSLLASHSREFFNVESLPYQPTSSDLKGTTEEVVIDSGQGGPSQSSNFYSFFPSTKGQGASSSSPMGQSSCNTEVGESIDLTLRL